MGVYGQDSYFMGRLEAQYPAARTRVRLFTLKSLAALRAECELSVEISMSIPIYRLLNVSITSIL